MRTNIRWRLTLWNALGFAVVLVGFAGLIYNLLARALYQQARQSADAAFRLMEIDPRLAQNPDERVRYWVREFDEHMGVLAGVYRADGRPIELRPDLERVVRGVPPHVETVLTDTYANRWLATTRYIQAGNQELTVLLLVPLRTADAELAALTRVLVQVVPVALLVSAGIAYLLARKALAPVDALRRSADAITAERLHDRLPVPNPTDELGKLATTVNAMIARLERSFTEMKRFTADASHELRTPLTAIRIEAETALDRAVVVDEYRAVLGSILEECGRMTRLTDQLLALAREDAGVVYTEPEPVNLGELVGGVAETLRPVAESKRLTLVTDLVSGVVVRGDPVRLRQVAMNLIDNAIKYTPEGGSIRVALGQRGRDAVVTVTDTGIGIPSEQHARVFERFYRVDKARSRDMGGTGLGLSIARSIVTAHGGTIGLTTSAGTAGITATVTLPLASAS